MQADDLLYIYEIRALDKSTLNIFDQSEPRSFLGDNFAGLHWETDFAFLFFQGPAGEKLEKFLEAQPGLSLREVHELKYAQWQDGADAPDIVIGDLTVSAPEKGQAGPRRLLIDPGLAFGFGGHPTTYYCLSFLRQICRHFCRPEKGQLIHRALDLGTGTGVLALAAARLGVKNVLGVDYSHLAIDAARHNVALNDLADQVQMLRGPAQAYAQEPGEILMANLHLSLQEELLDLGAFKNRHWVIISGLLPSEGDKLMGRMKQFSLKLTDQVRTDRWISALLSA